MVSEYRSPKVNEMSGPRGRETRTDEDEVDERKTQIDLRGHGSA